MKTTEYLWWIETIRQDYFRKTLPFTIVSWVAFTICLISFFLPSSSMQDSQLFFQITSISFTIAVLGLLIKWIILEKLDKRIKIVKDLWIASNPAEYKKHNEALSCFYDE
ncbi:MAG: hypothetical protein QY321_03805 [Patescibacteria group bacterium]|nr:MAG: hypothetical protein QY321_03805 [Patescibacteria group bacterium]